MSVLGLLVAMFAAFDVEIAASPLLHVEAPASGEKSFYDLMDEGVEARDRREFAVAARFMTQAFDAMPDRHRTGAFGLKAVREAVGAHRAQFGVDGNRESLRLARDLLRAYIDGLNARTPRQPLSEDEQRLHRELEALEVELAEPDHSPDGPQVMTVPIIEPPNDDIDPGSDAERRSPARGLGLLAVGAPLVVGGTGLLMHGLRFPALIARAKQDALDELYASDGALEPVDWVEHEARQRAKGRALVGVGTAALVTGAALTIWGAVWFVNGKEAPVSASPTASTTTIGISVHARF